MRTIEEIKADMQKPCDYTDNCELTAELILALASDIPLDRLEEICNAEREGRCAIVPCKVGDTVYIIRNKEVCAAVVNSVTARYHKNVLMAYLNATYIIHQFKCNYEIDANFAASSFGKTIFLTREEAEQAKEREQNG